jgi:uncharacterized membrane protein
MSMTRLSRVVIAVRPSDKASVSAKVVAAIAATDAAIQEPILIFIWGMLICSVVEYLASFVMEKAFSTVTWDYSDKLLNLHGRICLQYSCCWGLLALLVVYVLDRFLYGFVDLHGAQIGEIVLTMLIVSYAAVGDGYRGRIGPYPQARRHPQSPGAR